MLTSQTESRGGEALRCLLQLFFLVVFFFCRALFAEAEGLRGSGCKRNAKCKNKRRIKTKSSDDFAVQVMANGSNANIKCECNVWAAKTIAKLVKLFFLRRCSKRARCGLGPPTQHEGVLESRRWRAFTRQDGFGRAAEKKGSD